MYAIFAIFCYRYFVNIAIGRDKFNVSLYLVSAVGECEEPWSLNYVSYLFAYSSGSKRLHFFEFMEAVFLITEKRKVNCPFRLCNINPYISRGKLNQIVGCLLSPNRILSKCTLSFLKRTILLLYIEQTQRGNTRTLQTWLNTT